jgi:hypothetical protein
VLTKHPSAVEVIYCGNIPLPYAVEAIGRLRPITKIEKIIATGIMPLRGSDMHRLHPELIGSPQAGRALKHRCGGDAELRAAVRRGAARLPWPSVRIIYQPAGQGFGPGDMVVPQHRLAEVEEALRREFKSLARWEVRPYRDGRQPIEASREDRFANLFKTNTGARNALPTWPPITRPRRRRSTPRPLPAPRPIDIRGDFDPVLPPRTPEPSGPTRRPTEGVVSSASWRERFPAAPRPVRCPISDRLPVGAQSDLADLALAGWGA